MDDASTQTNGAVTDTDVEALGPDLAAAITEMGVSPSGPDRSVVSPSPTLFDLLPWRRVGDFDPDIGPVVRLMRHHDPRADVRSVARAYQIARRAHAGQTRKSGDPYVTHPVAVAGILADLGMDTTTVVSALLHDVVEDTDVSLADVRAEFGEEVAAVVDGVTKLDRLHFETKEAHQAATMRKMLVAMAKDVRVLVIKLADRLHNMRTLTPLAEQKRRRIAQETIDIYAPLAHRLGIQEIRWQLEDLAFAELQPKAYAEIEALVSVRHEARETELADVVGVLRKTLEATRVKAEVTGRPKHFYSIYEKMVVGRRSFDDIFDLLGVRIVVDKVADCYSALGTVHALWRPVQGRFKDFIAMPKFNLYQSLHTTVIGTKGQPVEIQIRTREMHRTAEFGVAAHWRYKEDGRRDDRLAAVGQSGPTEIPWLGRMAELPDQTADPVEFMDTLKVDLYQDEVFVFTPKGDVITLPSGATPIDFAYTIHTEIGHRTMGARLNGRLVPLDSVLQSGDTVEVLTSNQADAGPSADWLTIVSTAKARNKIRAWFSKERRDEAVDLGRDRVVRALRRAKLPVDRTLSSGELEAAAENLGLPHLGALYAAVGEGRVKPSAVIGEVKRLLAPHSDREPVEALPNRTARRSRSAESVGVHIEGLDDVLVKLARCCSPMPGDEIIAYVTRGRGVSVHRADCANAASLAADADRLIDVEWDTSAATAVVTEIQVEALDRGGLLADVTRVLSESRVNILAAQTVTGRDQIAVLRFEFEAADATQVQEVLAMVRAIPSVFEVFVVEAVPTSGTPTG